MDPVAIVIGGLLLGCAGAFVLKPLRSRPVPAARKTGAAGGSHDARAGRSAALSALRDLDFDFQTGKVNEQDYPALRQQLVAEAARYMQAQTEDEKLESLIRVHKASQGKQAAGPQAGSSAAGSSTCPSCGKRVKADDLFCRSCGARLEARAG